jgi:hypothetical protein
VSEGLNPVPTEKVKFWKGYLEKRGVKFEIGTDKAYDMLKKEDAIGLYTEKLVDIDTNTFERTIYLRKDFNASEFYEESLHAFDSIKGRPRFDDLNGIRIKANEYRAKKILLNSPEKMHYNEVLKLESELDLVVKGRY